MTEHQPEGFGSQAFALKFRDIIARQVRDVLLRERPPSRYGRVIDFNRASLTADVIFSGDSTVIRVRMAETIQPTMGDPVNGNLVRVDGAPGNYYISEIVSGTSYRHDYIPRLQYSMSGGGAIRWDGAYFAWDDRFLILAGGQNHLATFGFFELRQPSEGTILPVYASNIHTQVSVDPAGVPLIGYEALYYQLPAPGGVFSDDTLWRIVDINQTFEPPSDWILVAVKNSDNNGSPTLKLGTGEQIDHWHPVIFQGAWTNFGGVTAPAAYRISGDRYVSLRGVVKSGAQGSGNPIFTLPVGYRPGYLYTFPVFDVTATEATGAQTAGTAHTHPVIVDNTTVRLDVTTDGKVYVNDSRFDNAFISLSGITFLAEA